MLREQLGADAFPKPALDYLNDWADPDRAWLRKFYVEDSDEPHFDLTPATEKVIAWLGTLEDRSFVGTESRLLTLFDLLRQMNEGTETDPTARIRELQKRRDAIDADIAAILDGNIPVLDSTELKDRYQQFSRLARELLSDFREVEQNFRSLDRRVREQIALWDGGKGALLEEILTERDAIAESDQGKSFRAFWDFLMSSQRQDELTEMLDRLLSLPAIRDLKPDSRTRKLHYDWLDAGAHTQQTVADLSRELRRFLDDKAWLENRRIMDILKSLEGHALAVVNDSPSGDFMEIDSTSVSVELPFERPLFRPKTKPKIESMDLGGEEEDLDKSVLYTQVYVDKARLLGHIQRSLQITPQISLVQLLRKQPLEQGLAELVAYLQLGEDHFDLLVDDSVEEIIAWSVKDTEDERLERRVKLPRLIFLENAG